MNKLFLAMFLVVSMGCSALSVADAGFGSGGDKAGKNGSTFIKINLNVPEGEKGDNFRAVGKSAVLDGNNNVLDNSAYGEAGALALVKKGKGNRLTNRADSSSLNNPNGDFAVPSGRSGRVTAEKVSDNSSGEQSFFGDWE